MATYREIHGKAVKSLDTDPTAETDAGQIWYNTTTQTIKVAPMVGAWAAGENLPQVSARLACCGTQTAGLIWGTESPPLGPPAQRDEAFTYDGTDWATAATRLVGSISRVPYAGTQTAGLLIGGASGNLSLIHI